MLKGFVFDLDGVITDTAQYHYQAWKACAARIGITIDPTVNEALKGISRMESLEVILRHGHRENDFTPAEKEALATEKNNEYVGLLANMTPADILPGMQAFLEALKAADYKLALASASKNAPTILARLGLADYFDAMVDPATLTHGKPDPEIFVKGAELVGIKPSEAVGLEDAVAGIQAINAAGEFSVGIGDPTILHEADLNFAATSEVSLAAIENAFESKNG
ncbi:beta-phosphoglucomutase [Lacticaseibacillus mingshuiensis]|uniref:Beta-phosphoglucomutase n=1 Tax=Lacticaseibacillus mingshuiensis TaxID=2799574 RepID=A0ABW4CHM6_9LACO|nr:beta-phosphoglucomutase [Lacticaseibacillus mingshuiensis]